MALASPPIARLAAEGAASDPAMMAHSLGNLSLPSSLAQKILRTFQAEFVIVRRSSILGLCRCWLASTES
jgi:hypothetical protein